MVQARQENQREADANDARAQRDVSISLDKLGDAQATVYCPLGKWTRRTIPSMSPSIRSTQTALFPIQPSYRSTHSAAFSRSQRFRAAKSGRTRSTRVQNAGV